MKLGERIWEELGILAQHVELLDHDEGIAKVRAGTSKAHTDAINAVIAAHDAKKVSAEKADLAEQQKLRTDSKELAIFKALEKATLAEIDAWVDANFSGMTAQQRAFLKMLAAGVASYLREK